MSVPRVLVVLTATLLLVTVGGAALQSTQSSATSNAPTEENISPAHGTTAPTIILPPTITGPPTRSNFTTAETSVTTALSMQSHAFGTTLSTKAFENRYRQTSNQSARQVVLANATSMLKKQTNALYADSKYARTSYENGSFTTHQYTLSLARSYARANSLLNLTEFIQTTADQGSPYYSQATQAHAQLVVYKGTVQQRIANAVTGDGSVGSVYVGSGPNRTSLAIINGTTYVRSTVRPKSYNAVPAAFPSGNTLLNLTRRQYPWVMNQSPGISFVPIPITTNGNRYAYRLNLVYSQGQISAYVDTSTQQVYQEDQTIDLGALDTTADVTRRKSGYVLNISRAYAGGPLHVAVKSTGGVATSARIRIDNRSVGDTGLDGELWTLSPAGTYTVTAETNNETNVTVQTSALS